MTDYDYTLLVHLTKNTMIEVFFQIAQNKIYLVIIVSFRSPWKPEAIDVPSTQCDDIYSGFQGTCIINLCIIRTCTVMYM